MKFLKFYWVPLLCCALRPLAGMTEETTRPNIIFFLGDDQRYDVLGCYGNSIIQTPTIDQLSADGVRFQNAFCAAPICATSRASIFTGMSQRTHGFNFDEPPISAEYIITSYPSVLRAAGYRTGFAGKFGVEYSAPGLQFDFFKPVDRNPYLKEMPDGTLRHETDLCADAAIEFIKSNPEGTPFCMSVSFNASHAEDKDRRPGYHFQWPESTDGLYEDVEIPAPRLSDAKYFNALPPFLQDEKKLGRKRYFWRWDTPEKYQTNIRAYFRMITGIDNAIARVLHELKAQGLDQNTIIIYSADNGYMMGDRGLAGKWNHYDQSLHIPLIICDPRLPAQQRGRVIQELINNIDLAPTFVEWAGMPSPKVYQGRSLVSLVENRTPSDWRNEIYCEHMFRIFNDWHGIRGKRYKYAVYYDEPTGPYECLYDLEKDPDELVNLTENPEYAGELQKMRKCLAEYLDEIPARKKDSKALSPVKK